VSFIRQFSTLHLWESCNTKLRVVIHFRKIPFDYRGIKKNFI